MIARLLLAATLMAACVVALVAWLPGADALLERLAEVPWTSWGVAAAGMLCSYSVRAKRLVDEWPSLNLGWIRALRIVLMHNAAVLLLPLRAGEAGYPVLLHRRFGIPVADATASLVWMRLQDMLVLLLIAFVAFTPVASWPIRIGVALGVLATLLIVIRRWADRFALGAQSGPVDGRWRRRIAFVLQALRQGGRRAMHRGWTWAFCNWVVKTAALGLLLAVIVGLQPVDAMKAALLGEAAGSLPLHVPAGFGAWEAGVWLAARWSGATLPSDQLLAGALVVHVFAIGIGLSCAAAGLAFEAPRSLLSRAKRVP